MQVVPAVNDEKFDQMIEDARQISDRSEYMKALHEAEDYLVEMDYLILERNYRLKFGEIDIIAAKDGGLVLWK